MLSAQDFENLTVPLGLYLSSGESKEEVRHMYLCVTPQLIRFCFFQFDKIVDALAKKPFAAKVDSKYYSNMFVIYVLLSHPKFTFR